MHTLAYTNQFHFLYWASALDRHKVSALGSRVSWTPAHNNEQTNAARAANKDR